MRLLARALLAASLALNGVALLGYFAFSQGSSTRDAAARAVAPRTRLSEEAAQDLLLLLEARGVALVNASASTRLNTSQVVLPMVASSESPELPVLPEDRSDDDERSDDLQQSSPGMSSQVWYAFGTVLSSLRVLVLLLPAVFGSAAFAAAYWQVVAWRRPLVLGTAASFVVVSVAQVAGMEGATTAIWFYAVVSCFGILHTLYTSDGISRAILFWRLIGRMILHYKLVRWWAAHSDLESPELESVYSKLHHAYAPQAVHASLAPDRLTRFEHLRRGAPLRHLYSRKTLSFGAQVLDLILKLRGFYIKLGQVISVIDMVPEPYRNALSVLQSGVPPKPVEQVHQIIAMDLGKSVNQLFASFDDAPLGSASIGQVHRAKLKDGRDVVVKVQYEEVRRLFATDFSQLQSACYFWTPQAMNEMRELRSQFMAEFDFRREGRVMSQIADNLAVAFPRVAVPRPIPGMVTENVLVMTYLPGGSLLDAIKRMAQAYADAQGISVEDLKARLMAEAREGNGGGGGGGESRHLMKINLLQAYARSTQLAVNAGVALYNSSIGLFATPKKYREKHQLIEISATIKLLCSLLGHQVLVDGLFSSDPHPGNLLLLPDGRLGLIDFGQVKRLTTTQRLKVARIVIAVATNNEEAMLQIARNSNLRTQNNDPKALVQYVRMVWAGNVKDLSRVTKDDPVISTDAELVMLRRAVILIRALSAALSGSAVNMATEWEPIARKVLADAGGDECPVAEPGIDAGGGVCVWLRMGQGTDAKYESVDIEYSGPLQGRTPLSWVDETEQFMWPHKKVRGSTLHPVVTQFGLDALVRVVGCAARGAAEMKVENGFILQSTPKSDEDDDRLQLLRALCYLSWGISSGSMSRRDSSPQSTGGADHYYVISAGIKSIKLCGPFTTLNKAITQSAAIEKQVRKYFPRAFFTRLEVEGRSEVAPLMNGLLDPLKALLESPTPSDPHGETISKRLLYNLFGSKLELVLLSQVESVPSGIGMPTPCATPCQSVDDLTPAAIGGSGVNGAEAARLCANFGCNRLENTFDSGVGIGHVGLSGGTLADARQMRSNCGRSSLTKAAAAVAALVAASDPQFPTSPLVTTAVGSGEATGEDEKVSGVEPASGARVSAGAPPGAPSGDDQCVHVSNDSTVEKHSISREETAEERDAKDMHGPASSARSTPSRSEPLILRSRRSISSPRSQGSGSGKRHFVSKVEGSGSVALGDRSNSVKEIRSMGKLDLVNPACVPPTRARLEGKGTPTSNSCRSVADSCTESESAISDRDFESAEEEPLDD